MALPHWGFKLPDPPLTQVEKIVTLPNDQIIEKPLLKKTQHFN